jgi:phosphoesterase RecJ-like protein
MKELDRKHTADLLRNASRVLILGHANPDGDCIGSMAALRLALEALGKQADAWADDPVPLKYRFLDSLLQKPDPVCNNSWDLAVCVDTPCVSRLGIDPSLLPSGLPVLCIDHHRVCKEEFDFVYEDTGQSAVGCMLYDLFEDIGAPLTTKMAEALYAAIVTDTGCFTNRNTNVRAFQISVELINAGADPGTLAEYIYLSASVDQLRVLGEVLNSLELLSGGKGALMYLSDATRRKCGAENADTENFVNYARSIYGVKVAAMLIETEDGKSVRISLRSKDHSDDVRTFAENLGGGGHPCAAGATAPGSLEKYLPEFRRKMNEFIQTLPDDRSGI